MPSWTIPQGIIAQPAPLPKNQEILGRDVRFRDGNTTLTAAGDYTLLESRENLRQSLYRRWSTEAGEYAVPGKETYGAGARGLPKKRANRSNLEELRTRMTAQALEDPRVESVEEIQIVADPSRDGLYRLYAKVRSFGQVIAFEPIDFQLGGS